MVSISPNILFVCTGNIFRSMSAEWASRNLCMIKGLDFQFCSAGTDGGVPREINTHVRHVLQDRKIDITDHKPRLLTAKLIAGADLVVAMSTDHQEFMQTHFGVYSVLFRELAEGKPEALLDVDEAVIDFKTNMEAADKHIAATIDFIVTHCAPMLDRLPLYLK